MIEIFVGLLSTFLTSEIDNYNFKVVNDDNYKEILDDKNSVFARFGIGEVEEIDLEN